MPDPSRNHGESARHRALKAAAVRWALDHGYRSAAPEIRLPNSNFRADVAAYRTPRLDHLGHTAVFECKQSRPDFLNHARPEHASLARLTTLNARRHKLESLLGTHYPHLDTGDSLFPEFRRHDLSAVPHPGYHALVREIRTLERTVFARTKFDRIVRYRCADACYLVAYPNLFSPDELPHGWGLLVADQAGPDPATPDPSDPPPPLTLTLARPPTFLDCPDRHRLTLLHRLAIAASRTTHHHRQHPP